MTFKKFTWCFLYKTSVTSFVILLTVTILLLRYLYFYIRSFWLKVK